MISYRVLANGLRQLNIPSHQPVMAHISNSAVNEIKGGADTFLAALLATVDNVMLPTFTYQTMVIPRTGPTNNALDYEDENQETLAESFTQNLPCHPDMGETAEKLRNHPQAQRSRHPILSFCGVGVDAALDTQTLSTPWAPIQMLSELQGWVLLVGTDQTVNCTLHLAEAIAGRKQFIRWALSEERIVECPHFPGCSRGFNAIDTLVQASIRQSTIGSTRIRAYSMQDLIGQTVELLRKDRLAMLCSQQDCIYCTEVRRWIGSHTHWISLR